MLLMPWDRDRDRANGRQRVKENYEKFNLICLVTLYIMHTLIEGARERENSGGGFFKEQAIPFKWNTYSTTWIAQINGMVNLVTS